MKPLHMELCVALALLGISSNAMPQITVYDAPNEVHFAATVDTLKEELEQVRTLTSSVYGLRTLGAELKSLSVAHGLPGNLMSLYAALELALPSAATSNCVGRDAAALALCQLDASKTTAEQRLAADLYSQAPGRESELSALLAALLAAGDLKTSADLGARSGIANASLENQRLQVELFTLQSALEDASILKARRADQLSRVMTPARAVDSLSPMVFLGNGP